MGLIEQKKSDKRRRLLNSAFSCFAEKGASNTSIAEICSRAQIAKGTFYLYYKDKEELINALNLKLSKELFDDANECLKSSNLSNDYSLNVRYMIDNFCARLVQEKDLLNVLRNDFTWTLSTNEFLQSDDEAILDVRKQMQTCSEKTGLSLGELYNITICLLKMTVVTCYASVTQNLPDSIEEMQKALNIIAANAFQTA